ncbi:Inosose dehydratase [bacterium HR40]|nr:Inosose dehydratase [bacterium HR40]
MAVQLGIAPIGWSNDDLPELGGQIPLEQCLAEAALAGYAGVEKGGKFPTDPKALGRLLARYGLRLVTGWFSGQLLAGGVEAEKERARPQLDLFRALGVRVFVYAETTGTVQNRREIPLSRRPRLSPGDFAAYGAKLTALADWLAAEGCPMTFHHHMGTVIETEEEIDRLMETTGPSVGLLLDTGHLTFAGGSVERTIRRWADRINHVHCKNVRPAVLADLRAADGSFLDGVVAGVFTVPGDPEGCVDFDGLARLLGEIGYRGWVVVEAEQDPQRANPFEMAALGFHALQTALRRAGIAIER